MSGPSAAGITLLPYSSDPLQYLCEQIGLQHSQDLPDLSRLLVLIPGELARQRLGQSLLATSEKGAMLAPKMMSLAQFVQDYGHSDHPRIDSHARELLLVEALRQHPDLYGNSNPWLLAENLLQFFDELNHQQCTLPDEYPQFSQTLQQGYGLEAQHRQQLAPLLNREAELVYTLWQAWTDQLQAEGRIDPHADYSQRLATLALPTDFTHCYLLGYSRLNPAEAAWFSRLAQAGKASLYLQGQSGYPPEAYHPNAVIADLLAACPDIAVNNLEHSQAYSVALDAVYAQHGAALAERARSTAEQLSDSPIQGRLQIFTAESAEQQALGIELQVRLWLQEGIEHIGIVSQDRRLARRLRALLERAGILLQDQSGWALSTTSAAAVLERWLECIEQDFDHLPLLDLLKSPFMVDEADREAHLKLVYRFEQDIVLHENIASGLWRYRRHIDARYKRLPEDWGKATSDALQALFNRLEQAASPLLALIGKPNLQPTTFILALQESLHRLGLFEAFSHDDAGQRLLIELEGMTRALDGRKLLMHWSELRSWLGRTLERYNFCPQTPASRVSLMDMDNAALSGFDALIIAAADQEHLPGQVEASAFFNDGVRQALGLSISTTQQRQRFYQFRCLLESSPHLLISYHSDQNGESLSPSPWLSALQHFHELAWDNTLEADHIQQQLAAGYHGFQQTSKLPAVEPVAAHPRTPCPARLLPGSISASSYQQLIDCPYQFFAARCLKLKTTDEIRTALEKSDYGNRIHACLQAFHSQVNGLPPPFTQDIDANNRQQAIEHLQAVSEAVFARDLEDNFQHRGWLRRWQQLIPLYIDWQQQRQQTWHFSQAEYVGDSHLNGQALQGRLDRLDVANDNAQSYAIIDYKTGYTPLQAEVDSGEAVQLPFYALLLGEHIQRVEYLLVDTDIKGRARLEGEALEDLRARQQQRLGELVKALQSGAELPAWGDDKTCGYCTMQGLCRRGAWGPDEATV